MSKRNVRSVVFPLITAFIWGSAFIAQSLSAGELGAFTFTALRSLVGAASLGVLWLVMRRIRPLPAQSEGEKRAARRDLLRGGVCCGVFLTAGSVLQQAGLEKTTPGKAAFITALYVVIVPLLGALLGRRVSPRVLFSVAVAVAGLSFLCFDAGTALRFSDGDLPVVLCAFAFAGQILTVDHFARRVDGVALSCVQFAVTALLSGAAALLTERIEAAAVLGCAWYVLYVGVFSSGVGYTLQILAQKDGDPAVVSLLLSLESFFAVVCSAVVLHERLSAREYFGCALMLFAVVLSQLPENLKKKTVAPGAKIV